MLWLYIYIAGVLFHGSLSFWTPYYRGKPFFWRWPEKTFLVFFWPLIAAVFLVSGYYQGFFED